MRSIIALLLALTAVPSLEAATESGVPLRDYIHTAWTHNDGVPLGFINRILQTSDGYLWVLTRDALLRFDGMRFVHPSTPCTRAISDIAPAVDGGLWAICGEKLIRRTADGRFVEAPRKIPADSGGSLLADCEGRLWLLGGTIRSLEPDGTGGRALAPSLTRGFFIAAEESNGTLWASGGGNLYHLHPDRIDVVSARVFHCFTPARAGGVFAVSGNGIWHLRKGTEPSLVADLPVSTLPRCMSEAADGGLWVATRPNGIALLRDGRLETLADTGKMDSLATYVFSDREGAMWIGATDGLHRLRKPTVQIMRLSAEDGVPSSVFVDSHENLWIGSSSSVVRYANLKDGTAHSVTLQGSCWGIGEDETGTVWLSTRSAIGYVAKGTFVAVSDDTGKPIANVDAFKQDHLGHLWALSKGAGAYRVTPGPPRLILASPRAFNRFLLSERTGAWIGIDGGGVEQQNNGRTNTFPRPNPALRSPAPRAMLEDGNSIWVGSLAGLERLRNGTWTTWTREHGLPGDGRVKAIIADRSGHFWMMTGGGLLRLPRAQLEATPDGSPRPLSFARIGTFDGVVPHGGDLAPSPSAPSDRAGRLYFTTQDAIVVVDPSAVIESSMIPPIVLESVIIDNQSVDRTATTSFVEPSRLQFEYTSLSLRSPEYARFRYRLEGHDPDWIEAGTQRQVTYGTLHPGAYRFRVIGAGSEGVWNETGASFAFRIVPVFWRTWWFRTALLLVGSLLVVGLHRLRVRQLTRQFNIRLEARLSERTRIARELHDTLLQSFHGVLFHFQAATNLLPGRPDDAKRGFQSAIAHAARAITEARDAVQALRAATDPSADLAQAIRTLGDELSGECHSGPPASVRVNVEGSPRSLHPGHRDDVYRIAGEAVRNAMRHAQAQLIQVDIHYDDRRLRLRIRDDGKGIDAKTLEDRAASGHWGLPGMRERAELIGGTLEIQSGPGSGTEIDLSIPASNAYAAPGRRRRFRSRKTQTDDSKGPPDNTIE